MTRTAKWLMLVLVCWQSTTYGAKLPWNRDDKVQVPTKVIPFWSEGVLNQPDAVGTRGLGGRLLFYGKDPKKTIKVRGTLVVYVFDEAGRNPDNVAPDRKYVYKPDDFEKTHAKNEVGHSYNIWVPWDEVGGPQKELSLIVRFTAETGELVVSEQQKQRLTGSNSGTQPVNGTQLAGVKPGTSTNVTLLPPGTSASALPLTLQQVAFEQTAPNGQNSNPNASGVMQAVAIDQANGVQQAAINLPLNGQQATPMHGNGLQQGSLTGQQFSSTIVAQPPGTPNGERRMETTTIQLPPMSAARWTQTQTMPNGGQIPAPIQSTWPASQYVVQPNQLQASNYPPTASANVGTNFYNTVGGTYSPPVAQPAVPGAFYAHGSVQPLSQKLQQNGIQQATKVAAANGIQPVNGAIPAGGVMGNSEAFPTGTQSTSAFQNTAGFTAQGSGSPAAQVSSINRQGPPNLMQGQVAAAPTQFGAHYAPGTRPAQAWQSGQPSLGPAQWQQFPAAPRFGQPALPGQGQ